MDIKYDSELDCFVLTHNGEVTALGAANYEDAVEEAKEFLSFVVN